ncbi:MAG TPA: tetratricopeptide repeat protein [Verrucomicrobiae bacterium]
MKKFALFLLIAATAGFPGRALAAADAAPAPPTNTVSEAEAQMLRSFLMLQDQLRTTQRAVEDARDEAQAEAKRTAELMSARLNLIEQTLNAQREQELQNLQRSTHTMIVIVGITTAVGFIAVLIAGLVQARAAMRLTEVSRQLAALPAPRFAELTAGTNASAALSGESVEAANASLLGAIDRLEHRLEEMETTTGGTHTATNGHKQIASGGSSTSQIATVLSKGQTLLNLDKPEEALSEFDEALQIDPRSIEAWIKRGTALERLQRIDEAITSYDQAIAIDGSTATAYLFKAGVYNRQKKYAEALQCYEKALNAQQKSRAGQAPVQTA